MPPGERRNVLGGVLVGGEIPIENGDYSSLGPQHVLPGQIAVGEAGRGVRQSTERFCTPYGLTTHASGQERRRSEERRVGKEGSERGGREQRGARWQERSRERGR